MSEPDSEDRWDEQESRIFIDYGRYFVPERERQIRLISALLPQVDEPYAVFDLACGEGILSEIILEQHPTVTVFGLEGSLEMLRAAGERLARFGPRFETRGLDLFAPAWPDSESPVRGIVSSLAIHHLDGPGKEALFREVYKFLAPDGAFVIADLIEPASRPGWEVAADAWDEAVRERALELDGSTQAFEIFKRQRWNMYRFFDPDDIDRPSPLYDQLRWLNKAGFTGVDVFWMLAGHAIFGGYK